TAGFDIARNYRACGRANPARARLRLRHCPLDHHRVPRRRRLYCPRAEEIGPMIITNQVTKNYGTSCVVDGVTLELPQGGVTSIIGPNGRGHATLRSEEHTSELQSREKLVCR